MLGVIKDASHESTSGGRGRVCIYGFESGARVASGRLSWQVDIDALEARCADLEGEESGANADDALDDALRPAHSGADSPPQDGASVATEEEPAAPVDFEWLDDLLCPSDVDGPRDVELFPEEELSGDALVAPPLAAPATPPSATGSSGVAHGAASSSGDVAPPPMAPPAPVGRRGKAAYVLFVPGGKLNYYGGSQQNCVAECNNVAHGKCIMTRKMKPHAKRLKRRRPLGFLAAWLAKGIELRNKDEHFYDRSNWPTREERRAARGRLMELDNDDARGLLAVEPAVKDGEATEPDDIELY